MPRHRPVTRREFVRQGAAALALPAFLPSFIRAAPSKQVRLAGVGVGGKGWSDIHNVSKGQKVVAVCDVDARRLGKAAQDSALGKPEAYSDWRKLLEREDIDALTVSTPDHTHAPVAYSAVRLGKHVYVQKPLTHEVHEARALRLLAEEKGVVTQMGNQRHSSGAYRAVVEIIRSGTIGKVKETHAWSNRPIWPQGLDGPPQKTDPVPSWLNWDLWLGVAPERSYVKDTYHPFKWRGWSDFGTGALGDMGCHIIDPVFWALELEAPHAVRADCEPIRGGSFPNESTVRWTFPATRHCAGDEVSLTWHDGGRKPGRDLVPLPEGKDIPSNGSLFIGTKGVLLAPHGGSPQLLPASDFAREDIPDVPGEDHYMQWTRAILGEGEATSHFGYAGPLTETVLLGNVALHEPGKSLRWDAERLEFPGNDAATARVRRDYRTGWEVKGLS